MSNFKSNYYFIIIIIRKNKKKYYFINIINWNKYINITIIINIYTILTKKIIILLILL